MAKDRPDFGFGLLNPIKKKKISNLTVDTQDSSVMDILRNTIQNSFTEDSLENSGPYKGIVLRIEEQDDSPVSWLKRAYAGEQLPFLRTIKVRIPELHAHLPEPAHYGDNAGEAHKIIDLYPSFIANSEEISNKTISPGDIVLCDFVDRNNLDDGIYLDVIFNGTLQGGIGRNSESSNFIERTNSNLGSQYNSKPKDGILSYLPFESFFSNNSSLNENNLKNRAKEEEGLHNSNNKHNSMPKIQEIEMAYSKGQPIGEIKPIKLPSIYSNRPEVYVSKKIYAPLLEMIDAAKRDGIVIKINSGFRSHSQQQYLREGYEQGRSGFNLAAKPGYSNHQSGIAVDIAGTQGGFSDIYIWLANNAHRFGFINSGRFFSKQPESWHFIYLGKDNQRVIAESRISLSEKQSSFR